MEIDIDALFLQAARVEKDILHARAEYQNAEKQQMVLWEKMRMRFGSEIDQYMNLYTQALNIKTELEAKHYFTEGYRAAKSR